MQKISVMFVLLLASCGKVAGRNVQIGSDIDDMYDAAEGYYNSVTGVYINMATPICTAVTWR